MVLVVGSFTEVGTFGTIVVLVVLATVGNKTACTVNSLAISVPWHEVMIWSQFFHKAKQCTISLCHEKHVELFLSGYSVFCLCNEPEL